MKRFFLFCFLILLTSQKLLVAQEAEKPTDYTGWQKFESLDFRYGFKIPPTWVVHFKNDSGEYIFHSNKNAKAVDNLSIEINCKNIPNDNTLSKLLEDSKSAAKSRFKDFQYIDDKKDNVNNVATHWFTFLFAEGEVKKQGAQYCIVYNGKGYLITFSANMAVYNDQTEYLTTILNTFDVVSYQPCAKVTISSPEKWFTSSEKDSLYVFSAKDNAGKSPMDGVIKVMTKKLQKETKLTDFLHQVQAEIKAERPKVTFSPLATVPDLNGQKLMWFDIVEKDPLFIERYYVTVHQRCGFIITNICDKDKFETEFKLKFASSLKTFKLEK